MSSPSVVIVGAGSAGVAAYSRLRGSHVPFDLTLLEAEGMIGGRTRTVEFGGGFVDMGGQWVHGERGNLVYETVKGMDLLRPALHQYDDFTFYASDGRVLDKAATDELSEIARRISSDAENGRKAKGSIGEYFVKRFNEEVAASSRPELKECSDLVLQWFSKFVVSMNPAPSWYEIPTVGQYAFKKYEGHQFLCWKDKGYGTVLDVLLKKIPDPSKSLPIEESLHLNKEVARIAWDNPSSKVKVHCSDGSVFEADHCLLTVSLGVLQANLETLFDPPLPPFKTNAITNMSIGAMDKIHLRFPRKWWPDDLKGFSLCWTEEDRRKLRAELPNFEPSHEGRSWVEDVFGFYVTDGHPRVLLGYIVGHLVGEFEKLSDEVVIENCMYLLRRFTGGKYEIPEPEAILRSNWKTNPHFYGSYSYYGFPQHTSGIKTEDLMQPVKSSSGKEVLLFGGEATNPTRFSCVDGAIETGYREADRLIELYK